MPHKGQTVAVAGGVAAAAACAYVTYTRSHPGAAYVVVFLYGSKKGLRLPRCESLEVLRGQVESGIHVEDCRLFIARDGGKLELKSTADLQAAYSNTNYSLRGDLLLLATADNTPLSSDATPTAPLALVPVGPQPLPFIGNLRCLLTGPYKILPYNVWANLFTPDKVARWGDTVLLHLPKASGDKEILQGFTPGMADYSVTTSDPEIVAELLARQEDFPKVWGRKAIERKIQTVTGNGLFTSSTLEPDWENAHGLLPRAFNQIRIRNYFGVLLGKTRSFVAAWSQLAASGSNVTSVNDWLTCMTADAVVKASMGLDMANVERKSANEPLHPFIKAFRYAFKAVRGAATIQGEFGKATAWNPFFDGKKALADKLTAAVKSCEDMVDDMLEKTRKGEIGGSNSVLTAMLNDVSPANGEYVRLCNIYGQVMNLMIAGHETTAATLAWTLYYISIHPEVEARALQEIESVLGDKFEPTVDDVPKLFYLEACFREGLRLHPAVGTVSRDVLVDTTLKGKWYVPRGMRVDINNVALQRREDQWGGKFGDPCTYNPDRFMPGAAEETGRHPNAFNPWGFGVRACIGSQFALWEAKIFLAMVLRCFKLRVAEDYRNPQPSVADGGAAPTPHGLEFMIRARKGSDAVLKGITSQAVKLETAPAGVSPTATATKPPAAAAAATTNSGHGTPLLILYGSNTGTCEELANTVAAQATAAGFVVKVATLDAAAKSASGSNKHVNDQVAVLIVTSTYNGTPPDNAAQFAKWLATKNEGSLSKVAYAVFGVGNSQWAQTYQAFPSQVDLQLPKAGATKVLEMRSGDVDTGDWMETFIAWQDDVIRGLLSHLYITPPESYASAADGLLAPGKMARLKCRVLGDDEPGEALSADEALEKLYKNSKPRDRYFMLEVLENRELQSPGSGRSTRHVQLALPAGAAGAYKAGEHLEVMGNNDPTLVEAALKLVGLTGSERVEWVTNFADDSGSARIPGSDQALTLTLTASQVLTWLVDLAAVPTRRILGLLAESCPCPPEAAQLKQLASDESLYKERIKNMILLEVLQQYRSVRVSIGELASLLPRMGPRYYSISSSPLATPNKCSITVGKVSFTTPTGRLHNGAASATIAATTPGGRLMGSVRNLSSSFKLPEDTSKPVIMVGPGTGVAPMMAFLQERAALAAGGATLGPAHLFFGCRNSKEDYIYQSELEKYEKIGVLAGLHVAFSREGALKVYVQDLILQQGQALWQLFEAGAYVFVCGDARKMAPDVRVAFKGVAQTWGGKNAAAADSWMGSLLEAKRYLEDVWAG